MCGDGMPDNAGGRDSRPSAPTPFEWVVIRSAIRNRLSDRVTKTARAEARAALNHLLDRMRVTDRLMHEHSVTRPAISIDYLGLRDSSPDPNFLCLRQRALEALHNS